MAEVVTVRIEGLKELNEALQQLPQELRAGPLRRAVSAAAKVVQDQAVQYAPEDEGTLKRAIYRARDKENSSAVQESYIVGIRYGKRYRRRKQDAWYWRFLEFGTSKLAARPFIRPAFDTTHNQQLEAMRERLSRSIELAAAKLARKKA